MKQTKKILESIPWSYRLLIVLGLLYISTILTSYSMYKENQKQVHNTDTKQDIRALLEDFNSVILQKIDMGQKKFLLPISMARQVKLTNLSERPDFNKYLRVEQFTREDDFNDYEDPNIFIKGSDYYYSWMQAYYFYPKDALKK